MSFETIHFENAGGKTLSGRLDRPLEGAPLAYAIFAHCFTCSKQMRALLVLHAPVDDTVGIDNAAQIHRAARRPKSFIWLDTADHMLSNPTEADYAGSVIGWRLPIAARCTAR
jgi:fermentation-respiration switch protein FrsA (DUF1100 family)